MSRTVGVTEFVSTRSRFGVIKHVKGFGGGITAPQWKDRAFQEIGICDTLAFDGDPIKKDSFTTLVPDFLRAGANRRAIAFRDSQKLRTFKQSWRAVLQEFGDRITIVSVDKEKDIDTFGLRLEDCNIKALPSNAREFYFLGRVGINATSSKAVVCIGGGGVATCEAKAGISEGMQWTVLAVSRGQNERNETMLDWANENADVPGVTFITGLDENEAKGYKTGSTGTRLLGNCSVSHQKASDVKEIASRSIGYKTKEAAVSSLARASHCASKNCSVGIAACDNEEMPVIAVASDDAFPALGSSRQPKPAVVIQSVDAHAAAHGNAVSNEAGASTKAMAKRRWKKFSA
jgi:hypothetical protein